MLELLRKHARLRDLAADESIEWNAMAYEMRDLHRDTFSHLRSTTGVLGGMPASDLAHLRRYMRHQWLTRNRTDIASGAGGIEGGSLYASC